MNTRFSSSALGWTLAMAFLSLAGCSSSGDPTAPTLDFPTSVVTSTGNDSSGDAGASQSFAGSVAGVDRTASALLMTAGPSIFVDGATQWNMLGDLFDLGAVDDAIGRGASVQIEGTADVHADGSLLATTLKAETDESDDDGPGAFRQFDGDVGNVDVAGGSIQLADGTTVLVDGATIWDSRGDVFSLSALAQAVATGIPSRIEGDGNEQPDGRILATALKAETDDPDDDDDGTGDDDDGTGDDDDDDVDDDDGDDDFDDDDDDADDDGSMELRLNPDEWRLDWADGSNSGSGNSTLEVRIKGGDWRLVDPASIRLERGGNEIAAVGARFGSSDLRAEFSKAAAIQLVADLAEGATTTVIVRGTFQGGGSWQLAARVEIRD